MTKRASQIVMVGTFPPPMHGMAAVNAAARDRLLEAGTRVMVINTAPASLDRGILKRLGRLPRVMRGLAQLAGSRHLRDGVLYLGVAGGVGQVYDLAFLLLARARRMRVFAHHHSFAYLHRRRGLAAALVRAAGRNATHITQSEGMAQRLCTLYGVANVSAVSNAVFLVDSTAPARVQPRSALRVLGFLGNIAVEKGIFEFLDLMVALRQCGLPVRGQIAGPFQDAATERQVRRCLVDLPGVEYLGPRYGAEKEVFLAGIDALVFPTLYANEAEPLVIHESLRQGLPVIANGRGCIPEIIGAECGCVVPIDLDFVRVAMAQIEVWLSSPEAFGSASAAALAQFSALRDEHTLHWEDLQPQLLGGSPAARLTGGASSAQPVGLDP